MPAETPRRLNVTAARAGRIKDRLHGLDWLRASLAILVVMLHAGIPYMTRGMPGLIWSVESVERSEFVNLCCWWIDGFVMPLFFLMTGFFAARLFKQRGANGFLKHRAARIGGPLLFGMVFILPLDLYAWLLGWVQAGWIPISKLKSLKVEGELAEALWGLSHLWFLEYVLLYCVAAWMLHHAWRRLTAYWNLQESGAQFLRSLPSAFTTTALIPAVALAAFALWSHPRVVIGFRHGWLPLWENALYYAVPFALGWCWERRSSGPQPARWEYLARLIAAQAVFVLLWPRLMQHVVHETIPVADVWTPILFATFSLLMTTGAFGAALSLRFERPSTIVSYLAKASFWIYLLHHPVIGLAHVDLVQVSLPAALKFAITCAAALAMCLATYEAFVRKTWIGNLLYGHKEAAARPLPLAKPEVPARRQAA